MQINEDDKHSSTRSSAQKNCVCDVHKKDCTAIPVFAYLFTTDSGRARQQHSKSFLILKKYYKLNELKVKQDPTEVLWRAVPQGQIQNW